MTANKPQHCSVAPPRAYALLISFVFASQFFVGCAERRRPESTWRGAGTERPVLPATLAPQPHPVSDDSEDPVPELRLELPPPPPLLAVRFVPPRPHVAPAPSAESNVSSKPEPPVIAPQFSPEESSSARQQMIVSLSVAETNLARSKGKTLSSTQSDLAAKVKGFIGDARLAERQGDWTRARSLATKAQVLSEELVSSL